MSWRSNGVDRVRPLRKIPMWIGCIRSEKLQLYFVARTFALIAPVQYVLHQVSCSYETIPNAPKHYARTKTWVWGPMGWIKCVGCEKLQHDFVAQTFALIGPVHPVLHRVSCSYEMIPNAPKHYETQQNMSLGSNGVDQVVRCENYNVNSWHELMY